MYNDLRTKARAAVVKLRLKGIDGVCLEGSDDMMDILKLFCIEAGINLHSPLSVGEFDMKERPTGYSSSK